MSVVDKTAQIYKKGVDALATPFEATKTLIALETFQNKCQFEILIYPEVLFKSSTTNMSAKDKVKLAGENIKITASIAKSVLIFRQYLYAINDIPMVGYDFQRVGGKQYIKDTVYPEEFSCTFLENQQGSVKGFLREWQDLIATYDETSRDYYYNDNQQISKKHAVIMPQNTDMIPGGEWIKIDGMKIKTVTGITYDHAQGDNELITATFSADNIRFIELY